MGPRVLRQGSDGFVRGGFPDGVSLYFLLQRLDLNLGITPAQRKKIERLKVLKDDPVLELRQRRDRDHALASGRKQPRDLLSPELDHPLREGAYFGPSLPGGRKLRGPGLENREAVR
jgi:hypothetical protein